MKFAILGSGEKIYEDFFFEMAKRYPERVSMTTGFFPELSHKIYAGADMFLMPSQSLIKGSLLFFYSLINSLKILI